MSRRLEFLLKSTSSGNAEPFAWYGLAMEYRSLARLEESVAAFRELRSRAPDYVAMYLMCGQVLETLGRMTEARDWMSEGVARARAKGDVHASSELEAALNALG